MSVFPENLNTDLEIPRVDSGMSEISGDVINALRGAIFAIEKTLGLSIQGNKPDFATRLNVSIDSNGNIKSSALESAGLVTLPIVDFHIGTTAGIAESKLNLDFSTASLNNSIASAVVNITASEASFNSLSTTNVAHFDGTTGRHDGYDVDLTIKVRGTTTVEQALNEINNSLTVFQNSANDIFNVVNISSINTITDSILGIQSNIIDGLDRLHNSAVTVNKRGEQGSQGNLIDTTFASTIFQTDTALATNILQVMRPNVTRVSGKNLNLSGLVFGSADKLRIQAGGVDRDPLDVDLGNPSIIPTEDLNDVVSAINTEAQLAVNHYPISAYNINGRLVIAHNIQGPSHTITIESVAQSAHIQLGFEDIVSTEFSWSDGYHAAHIGGRIVTDMKPLLRIRYSHAGGDTVSPNVGDLLGLFGVDSSDQGRVICNILNHSVTGNNNNGTYYIRDFPTNLQFQLNTSIPVGEFDIDIVADSVNFNSTATQKIYDIFLEDEVSDGYDGYGLVTKSLRVDYQSIAGIFIKTINKTFPTAGTIQWRVSSGDTLVLIRDGLVGISVPIPNGFRGQLRAFMPDNINSALFEVTGNTSSSLTQPITTSVFAESDDRIYLSSVQHPLGTDILQSVTDKRQLGVSTKFQDELDPDSPESSLGDLRNNGIIRGFDVISNTTNTLKIRGGRALVSGKILDVETTDVTIDSFNGEFRLLALDNNGMFKTFDAYEPGYTTTELSADGYGDARPIATIVDFGTSLVGLTGAFVDRRLFVNKIDGRLVDVETRLDNRIDQLESAVGGILWGFTEAFTTEGPTSFVASIGLSVNGGFINLDDAGFTNGSDTTRRFEFINPGATKENTFKSAGMTHINVMMQANYVGLNGGGFSSTGTTNIQIGLNITTGTLGDGYAENYATVKTIETTVLPSSSVLEQYVVSIPTELLGLEDNTIFDVTARVRIIGSTFVGGPPGDTNPLLEFGKVRVIVSSYSIAGNILGSDGTTVTLATNLGNVL